MATVLVPLENELGATPRQKKLPAPALANKKPRASAWSNSFAALVMKEEVVKEERIDEKDTHLSMLKEEKGQVRRLVASPQAQGPRQRKLNQLPRKA